MLKAKYFVFIKLENVVRGARGFHVLVEEILDLVRSQFVKIVPLSWRITCWFLGSLPLNEIALSSLDFGELFIRVLIDMLFHY